MRIARGADEFLARAGHPEVQAFLLSQIWKVAVDWMLNTGLAIEDLGVTIEFDPTRVLSRLNAYFQNEKTGGSRANGNRLCTMDNDIDEHHRLNLLPSVHRAVCGFLDSHNFKDTESGILFREQSLIIEDERFERLRSPNKFGPEPPFSYGALGFTERKPYGVERNGKPIEDWAQGRYYPTVSDLPARLRPQMQRAGTSTSAVLVTASLTGLSRHYSYGPPGRGRARNYSRSRSLERPRPVDGNRPRGGAHPR